MGTQQRATDIMLITEEMLEIDKKKTTKNVCVCALHNSRDLLTRFVWVAQNSFFNSLLLECVSELPNFKINPLSMNCLMYLFFCLLLPHNV